MIYESQARAQEIADELNQQPGQQPCWVVLTAHGWSVIAAWSWEQANKWAA